MKKILVSGVVSAVLAGSVFAADSASNVGDFLIAPAFYSGNGFYTEMKVVNTDLTHSVAVRGVVRDSTKSDEVDFIVVLTPGDVWTGKISANASGNAVLSSNDDSNYGAYTQNYVKTAACLTDSTKNCLEVDLPTFKGMAGSYNKGYVEFYPILKWDETGKTTALINANQDLGTFYAKRAVGNYYYFNTTVDKNAVVQRLENLLFGTAINAKYVGVASGATDARDVDNILTGEVKVVGTTVNSAMTIPMTALADVSITNALAAVQANVDAYKATASTTPANYLATNAATGKLIAEEDLADTEIYATYDNSGVNNNVLFTFWNDTNANQERAFAIDVRNNHECLCSCEPVTPTTSTPTDACPLCAPAATPTTTPVDPISGKPTAAAPTPSSPTGYCYFRVAGEFGQVAVADMLKTPAECDAAQNWASGWVRMYNKTMSATSVSTAVLATQMRAANVNGQWSYNWNYVSGK
jgi:hypothetical protein